MTEAREMTFGEKAVGTSFNPGGMPAVTEAKAALNAEPIPARNMEIVHRIQQGEKRYLLAEEYGLTKPSITMIGRKAGIAAYSRPGRKS